MKKKTALSLLVLLVFLTVFKVPVLASVDPFVWNDVELRFQGYRLSDSDSPYLSLYVRGINDSDHKIWINFENANIDGTEVSSAGRSLEPHSDNGEDDPRIFTFWGSEDDKDAPEAIRNAKILEMTVVLEDNDTYEHLCEKKITLDLAELNEGASDAGSSANNKSGGDVIITDSGDTIIADSGDTIITDSGDTIIADPGDTIITDSGDTIIADPDDTIIWDDDDYSWDSDDDYSWDSGDDYSWDDDYTSAPASSYRTLQRGDKGDDVRRMQEKLIELGYLNDTADGNFGPKTAAAVQMFNEANGLRYDDIADNITQDCMFSGLANEFTEPWIPVDLPYTEWNYITGEGASYRVKVTNLSRTRTIKGIELQYYPTDVWGNNLWPVPYRKTTFTMRIAPGETVYTDWFYMSPSWYAIDMLHEGVSKIVFEDGEIRENDDITYWTVSFR